MSTPRHHLARAFADRNVDTVIVFANGHTYGNADRRKAVRQLVAMTRRAESGR